VSYSTTSRADYELHRPLSAKHCVRTGDVWRGVCQWTGQDGKVRRTAALQQGQRHHEHGQDRILVRPPNILQEFPGIRVRWRNDLSRCVDRCRHTRLVVEELTLGRICETLSGHDTSTCLKQNLQMAEMRRPMDFWKGMALQCCGLVY